MEPENVSLQNVCATRVKMTVVVLAYISTGSAAANANNESPDVSSFTSS